jgi:hypothetical protein
MSRKTAFRKWLILGVVWMLAGSLAPDTIHASTPARYKVTGCVNVGKFTSGEFEYQVKAYADGKWEAAALDAYEGHTIEIVGLLSPGDRLSVHTLTVIDKNCRPELYKSQFL